MTTNTAGLPTVHLNGTSRDALVAQRLNVVNALRAVMKAMRAAWPNGRDYYPQGDDALRAAEALWSKRLEAIDQLRQQVDAEAAAILDGAP